MAEQRERSDGDLLRSFRAGDSTALERLVERHLGVVHLIALSRLRDREAAEDLAQEVFLRALLGLDRLTDPERFGPWLARIARNLATDWHRRRQTRSRLVQMVPLDRVAHALPDRRAREASQTMQSDEERDELQGALWELSADRRELVLLHHVEGFSQREIAQRLGVNQATVSRRLDRALSAMRGSLAEVAPSLRAKRATAVKTVATLTVAAALSPSAKATLAQAAGSVTGSLGFFSTTTAALAAGGKIMATGKGIAAAAGAAVILVGGGALILSQSDGSRSTPEVTVIESPPPRVSSVTLRDLAGTWQFENPLGDDLQLSIFPDGRVWEFSTEQFSDLTPGTDFLPGEVVCMESGEDATVVQFGNTLMGTFLGPSGRAPGLGSVWRRVSDEPAEERIILDTNNLQRFEIHPISVVAGTWQFLNPLGDDEQISIYPDGRCIVFYSDGRREEHPPRSDDPVVLGYAPGAYVSVDSESALGSGVFLEVTSQAQGMWREHRRISGQPVDEPVIFN